MDSTYPKNPISTNGMKQLLNNRTATRRRHKAMSTSESSLFSPVSSAAAPSLCSISTYSSEVTSVASSALTYKPKPGVHQLVHERLDAIPDDLPEELPNPPIRFSQTFELSHCIGSKGALSTVWLARNKHTREQVAVKMIRRVNLTPNEDKAVFDEVAILKKLSLLQYHAGSSLSMDGQTIRLIDFFVSSTAFFIVTEYMDSGDMQDLLERRGRFLEEDVRQIIFSLLQAMLFVHKNGVAHRDLKPENLLISSRASFHPGSKQGILSRYIIKIADFGLAAQVSQPRSLITRCGTPMYVAPEVLRSFPYDQSCDMWSLGVIVYLFISGCHPFMDSRKKGLYRKILSGKVVLDGDGWDTISPEAKHFISSCLTVNPRGRISAQEALHHPWF